MSKSFTLKRRVLAAVALTGTLAFASPAAPVSAHVACGKHKPHHTNCGKHKGASKGKKKGHSKY